MRDSILVNVYVHCTRVMQLYCNSVLFIVQAINIIVFLFVSIIGYYVDKVVFCS